MANNVLTKTLYAGLVAGVIGLTSSCGTMKQLTTNSPSTFEDIGLRNILTINPDKEDSVHAFYVNKEYENKFFGENQVEPVEYQLTVPESRQGLLDSIKNYKSSFEASKVDESELYKYSFINDKPKKVYRINPNTIEFYKK